MTKMKYLTRKEFEKLKFAYEQGYKDALSEGNNFDEVVDNWFDSETEKTDRFLNIYNGEDDE